MMANAICLNHEGWKALGNQTAGLDVCQIAQELMAGTCQSDLEGLTPTSSWYTASQFPDASKCACTHVMYNLLSACAGCQMWNTTQDAEIASPKWPSFFKYGGGVCPGQSTLGANTTIHRKRDVQWEGQVPRWAESEVSQFNLTQALATAAPNASESTDTNFTAGIIIATSVPTSSSEPTPSSAAPSLTASTQSSNSGPNIGAIVGGVIGGLVLLGALVGLWFWLHCRRRRARDVAPSAEFIKPEYYASPPLLTTPFDRRDSDYHDYIEEEERPAIANRLSWAGGLVTNRRQEDDDGDMLPPFTRGTYIGPSPHEKEHPERRETGDSDLTMRTNATTTPLLPSSPARRTGSADPYL